MISLRAVLLLCVASICSSKPAMAVTDQGEETSWPTPNLSYDGARYSPLDRLDIRNVGSLAEVCRVQVDKGGAFQSALLVVDSVMYLTTRAATVALDPTDCTILWKSVYIPEQKEPMPVVRGPAYADGRVFRGTTDCRLLSLDARNGTILWQIKACDPEAGESLSAAPIVWQGMLFIGIAGGDFGVRGRVFAFDTLGGKEIWRFNTIPLPGETGAETWSGQTGQTGGGGTWSTYTLDPGAAELFVPVGNPGADFDLSPRPGKNLFTNSLVVLDAHSGHLKWWFQLNDRDDKDFDLGAAPVLLTLKDGRPAVALGSKDGFVYLIDRRSHRLLFKTAVTTVLNQHRPVTLRPLRICPGVVGGVEWNGPAIDQLNNSLVVGAVDWCADLQKTPTSEYKHGQPFMGGTFAFATDAPASGWVTSVDQSSGKVRWRFHVPAPVVSGVTTTAGGLVFFGDMNGDVYGLNSDDGTALFKSSTRGAIAGGVITYMSRGEQYLAVTSGNVSRLVWGETGLPSVVIYGQGAQPSAARAPTTSGVSVTIGMTDIDQGSRIYARMCSICHGATGTGLTGPPIKGIGHRLSVGEIAAWIMNPVANKNSSNGAIMPKLYPSALTQQDVFDTAIYVGTL